MAVLYFLVPLAAVLVTVAVAGFWIAARNGQFDDLDTPPLRVLFDDEGRSTPIANQSESTQEPSQ